MTYVSDNLDLMAHFGQTIVRLRESRYLSQEELASKAGVSRSLIQNVEKMASAQMQGSKYRAIAEALGMTPSELDKEWRNGKIEQTVGDPVGRGIPLINKAPAGDVTDYHECSMADSGQGHWYVKRDGITDPHAFAVIVTGESMMPTLLDKSVVVFSPMDMDGYIKGTKFAVPDGHIVFVRFGPEAREEGCTIARVYRKGGKIHLTKDNKKHKTIICSPEHILNMGAMVRYEPFQNMIHMYPPSSQLESKGDKDKQVAGRIHPDIEPQAHPEY